MHNPVRGVGGRGGQTLPLAVWPDYYYWLVGRARLLLLVLVRFGTIAITIGFLFLLDRSTEGSFAYKCPSWRRRRGQLRKII